jgi:hypothetical protein
VALHRIVHGFTQKIHAVTPPHQHFADELRTSDQLHHFLGRHRGQEASTKVVCERPVDQRALHVEAATA